MWGSAWLVMLGMFATMCVSQHAGCSGYKAYGDVCQCFKDCIDCNGGKHVANSSAPAHSCLCPPSSGGIDCLDPPICPAGTSLRRGHSFEFEPVMFSTQGQLVNGIPVDQMDRIKAVTAFANFSQGNVVMSFYGNATSTPVMFRLLFSACKGSPTAHQILLCTNSSAEFTGVDMGPDLSPVLRAVTGLSAMGPSTFGNIFVMTNTFTGLSLGLTCDDFNWCGVPS